MSKSTTKYQLGYFEEGDLTSSSIEMQRWETLDAQLYALFSVLGNGIISGWNILPSSGLSVVVAPGSGHVNFVSVSTDSNIVVNELAPNTTNYIYAKLTPSSYWDQTVFFVSHQSQNFTDQLYLGYAVTNGTDVTAVNIDNRSNLGFISLITKYIAAHRHIGGTGNPEPVNLSTDVQGILNQHNLPVLDSSIVKTGVLDQSRIPVLDHITHLVNQGTLTHSQLDSFVEALSIQNATLMGETSTIDLLQLILALKHIYPDIDQYLVNEIAYIPGISPDSYVDWVNTTADVDIRPSIDGGSHTITGTPTNGKKAYTYTWDNEVEFSNGTSSGILIDSDLVTLATQQSTLVIDKFSSLTQWTVVTNDLSSLDIGLTQDSSTYVAPPNSAKLTIGDQTVEIALIIKKEFDAMDWSNYGKITFYLKTGSVQHGDVYFYINDANSGTQNSYIKVLDRNEPTINVDTLENGWQEITIDISSYVRANINQIGFYVSSQDGWDTSKGFDLNIDNIFLSTGVTYKENGYIRVIFGGDFLYDFWRVRWDATIPSDIQSAGISFKSRTRVGNSLLDLEQSMWSAYNSTSGYDIVLPAPALYKYIEVEMFFGASTDFTRTPYLRSIFLDFYASDVDGSFVYDTDDAWNSGNNFNISVSFNTMSISHTEEINNVFYGSNNHAVQLDANLNQLYDITGSLLPRSTYQVLNNIEPSLGLITGVSRGNQGSIWMADLDNDRIIELDKSGALLTGFYGSNLTEPIDVYGTNTATTSTTTSTTTLALGSSLSVLQSIYNSNNGVLYVVFNENLENIYASTTKLNINNIYLKVGAQKFYLNDSKVELLGVDEQKYNDWNALYTSNNVSTEISQFAFNSHVLKITLLGADKTLLNSMVDTKAPSIVISSPNEQKIVTSTTTVNFLVYNFSLSDGNGIQVTLDGGTPFTVFTTSTTFTGLSVGLHTIKAQLINADLTLNTNVEAIAEGEFIVSNSTYNSPYIEILSPKINQIYSSSPVMIEFSVHNFPILATGQHLRYKINDGAPVDYYTADPISLSSLSAGKNTVTMFLVDKKGNDLGYAYGTVSVDFIVGLNSLALVKLYVNSKAIYNSEMTLTTNAQRLNVDVGNITFINLYCPIDIQVIENDMSLVNKNGSPTLLVAKMRTPSWTYSLGSHAASLECAARIAKNVSNTSASVTSAEFNGIAIKDLIYSSKFLDGYSVVQLDLSGNTIMSDNNAQFALSKEDARELLGSAEKIGENELIIGDSCNKRAIISNVDLVTQTSQVIFEYESDRYIPDFHLINQDNVEIRVKNDSIDESSIIVRNGTNVVWINDSSAPITIVSGTTSYEAFNLDPDLNLYGDLFKSQVLDIGERFSYKFISNGNTNYFCYPSILTGSIITTKNRVSDRDQYLITESDLDGPFSSRIIKVDSWGNVLMSFGEGYLVKPRDCRPLLNGSIIIST